MVSTALSLLRCENAQSAKSLKLLGRQIACFGAGDSVNHGIISGVIGHCLEFPDRCHHPKEDHCHQGPLSETQHLAKESPTSL